MINFTVGPVAMESYVAKIGAEQVPYFRTSEFSEIMHENEDMLLELADAPSTARAVFLTGSGTSAMEAAVINVLTPEDKVLVVDGGSFGHRFVELCRIHGVDHDVIQLEFGNCLTENELKAYNGKGYTAFLINMHETSTGVLYNMDLVSRFCRENNLLLIVDTISSFLADELSMKNLGFDVMIVASQKALACPPGVSALLLSSRAIDRVMKGDAGCLYLDLKRCLEDGVRGQTPFTCAVGLLRQLHERMRRILSVGGSKTEIEKCALLAGDFRRKVASLPFDVTSHSLSNAVTPLHPRNVLAMDVVTELKDNYGIWVCPNGGSLANSVFRVGHIGALTIADNDALIDAMSDMAARGLL